jgi:hypothetical protein
MAALKLLLATPLVFFTAALLLTQPCCEYIGEPERLPSAAFYIQRSEAAQEHDQTHDRRLQTYYESLSAALKINAPDLLLMLDPPKPLRHGYQILPKMVADTPSPGQRPPAQSAWYSWPWTDQLIDSGIKQIVRSEKELNRAAALSSATRRKVYEKLAHSYQEMRRLQQNIDAHIQYNRLWQAAIAADRAGYDRETVLYNEVLDLRQRETLLARHIHKATAHVSTPDFVRIEQRGPRLWILRVPFYTDIEDHEFVESAKAEIEKIWHLRGGADEFRVELAISYITPNQLYTEQPSPQKGDNIDSHKHLDLFPAGRAILTTGALTTHVYGRAIVLGPQEIAPRTLAHELGHILGFRDLYVRGYKDLGKDGFQVMEIVADSDDIMGAPATGSVFRSHFQRLLESSRTKGQPLSKS